jgi:pimeloyl-ACP methyl ester carboxylesterase
MPLPATPVTEHRIPRPGGSLYAQEYAGAGPAFVLMHGFPDNLHIYDDLVPYLVSAGRRVVTFDFLGFGVSDKPAGAGYSFQQQLGDIEAVTDALGLGEVVLVGHDSSGIAAVNFAVEHPNRVVSLFILNSAYDNSPLTAWPEMIVLFATPGLAALAGAIAQSPEQFGWLLGWQKQRFEDALPVEQKEHFRTFLGQIIADNFTVQPSSGPAFVQLTAQFFDELSRNSGRLRLVEALDVPVKVIWGEFDPYFPVEMGKERASHFRNASFHLIAAGHWLQSDAPDAVAKAMLS